MQKKQGYIYHSKQLKEKFPPQRTHHPAMRLQWSVRLGGLKGEGQPQVKLMVCQQVSGLRITARRFAGRVWMSVPDSGVREILISLFSLKKIEHQASLLPPWQGKSGLGHLIWEADVLPENKGRVRALLFVTLTENSQTNPTCCLGIPFFSISRTHEHQSPSQTLPVTPSVIPEEVSLVCPRNTRQLSTSLPLTPEPATFFLLHP